MSASTSKSPLGVGLYFIDVLACLLFCLTLALVSARFGRETSLAIELPELAGAEVPGAALSAVSLAVRGVGPDAQIFLEGEPIGLDALEARLRASPPPAVVVRSETTMLAQVIAAAHDAGVTDIQLAYEQARGER